MTHSAKTARDILGQFTKNLDLVTSNQRLVIQGL